MNVDDEVSPSAGRYASGLLVIAEKQRTRIGLLH